MVLLNGMAVSYLTGEMFGFPRKEETVSVSEVFQLVIMLCAISKFFYDIGKDIHNKNDKHKNKSTKKITAPSSPSYAVIFVTHC